MKRQTRTFIYPTSRQYPVDSICEQIVRALQKQDFSVPDISVTKVQPSWRDVEYVTVIKGSDFEIQFEQRDLSCEIAVTRILIPGNALWLSRDPSHIFFQVCADDKQVGDCRKNHPEQGLCTYRGSESGNYVQPPEFTLPIYLVATDDSHWLKHGCRSHYLTRAVLSGITDWLRKNLLDKIQS